jgi:predicted XRE-type DNA-binding protein
MKIEEYESVWDAIEDDPAERERLKMRSTLLTALRRKIEGWKVTQGAAAKRLNITQPRLNDLLKGRFNKFSLGALFDLATRAGLKVKLTIRRDGQEEGSQEGCIGSRGSSASGSRPSAQIHRRTTANRPRLADRGPRLAGKFPRGARYWRCGGAP